MSSGGRLTPTYHLSAIAEIVMDLVPSQELLPVYWDDDPSVEFVWRQR